MAGTGVFARRMAGFALAVTFAATAAHAADPVVESVTWQKRPYENVTVVDVTFTLSDADGDDLWIYMWGPLHGEPDCFEDNDSDGVPEAFEDHDGNGVPDVFDDWDGDGTPDWLEDNDWDGWPDHYEDRDGDSVPDYYERFDQAVSGTGPLTVTALSEGGAWLTEDGDGDGAVGWEELCFGWDPALAEENFGTLAVVSASHPVRGRWYNNTRPSFTWPAVAGSSR